MKPFISTSSRTNPSPSPAGSGSPRASASRPSAAFTRAPPAGSARPPRRAAPGARRGALLRGGVPGGRGHVDLEHGPRGELLEGPRAVGPEGEEPLRVETLPPVDPLRGARVGALPADDLA